MKRVQLIKTQFQPWAVLMNEGCLLTYIVLYIMDIHFFSTMTLWYYKTPFCIRPSMRYLY